MMTLKKFAVLVVVLAAAVWAYYANVASGRATMDMNMRVTSGSTPFPVTLAPVERGPIADGGPMLIPGLRPAPVFDLSFIAVERFIQEKPLSRAPGEDRPDARIVIYRRESATCSLFFSPGRSGTFLSIDMGKKTKKPRRTSK